MSLDLDFSGQNTHYATHGLHSYAAKCPPQLVQFALDDYTKPGDIVIDPMVGSGTSLVEAKIHGRNAIGFDIDPLACLIARVKSRFIYDEEIESSYSSIINKVVKDINNLENGAANKSLLARAAPPTFLNRDYWFNQTVQRDLALLSFHIENANFDTNIKEFLWAAFSGIILSKVSVANARDITHSRHHYFSHPKSPKVLDKFDRRIKTMRRQMLEFRSMCDKSKTTIKVVQGDARYLSARKNSADMVFTSPPYATALDYPRALFLAVNWMEPILGVTPNEYKQNGNTYIGSERGKLKKFELDENLGSIARKTISQIATLDQRKANLVQRYFQDMDQVFGEIGRVLRPNKYAVIVVCPSHIRKIQVPTHKVFTELASQSNLDLVAEHIRTIDSGKRLLPHVRGEFGNRMSTEYVLVYQKRK